MGGMGMQQGMMGGMQQGMGMMQQGGMQQQIGGMMPPQQQGGRMGYMGQFMQAPAPPPAPAAEQFLDFWRYAAWYGEPKAREYYGAQWSPPAGSQKPSDDLLWPKEPAATPAPAPAAAVPPPPPPPPPPPSGGNMSAMASGGRGRGATMPAWMTQQQ